MPVLWFPCAVPVPLSFSHDTPATALPASLIWQRQKKLSLPADQRKALLRSLTTEVIRHGRITTTLHRAKAVRGEVERMIGLAKDGSLAARRKALGYMYDKNLVHALFEQAPDRCVASVGEGEGEGEGCRNGTGRVSPADDLKQAPRPAAQVRRQGRRLRSRASHHAPPG